jgi:hypothetical protein
MNDWEDWEGENIVTPDLHVPNKEQIKRLEERKKIEESEIALMKDFFDNNNNTSNNTINNKETTESKINKVKIVGKQRENELKQKELSEKIRKKKEKEKKHSDLFCEVIHDKYDDKTF